MNLLRKITDTFLYSNIYIAFCAVALTQTNQLTIYGAIQYDNSIGFVFFATVFTYSFLKFRRSPQILHGTTHHSWVDEHPEFSKNVLLISLVASAFFFIQLVPPVKLVVVLLGLFTALYALVPVPFTKPKKKLRDFGLLKTVFVAIVWSVITVVVPLSGSYMETDMLLFLLLRRFLFILALTIVFEIKDLKSDEAFELQTLPMRLGIANTKLLAQAILLLLILLTSLQYLFFELSLPNMLAVNLSLLVSAICIQPVEENTHDYWYYLLLDGMMILQFLLVCVAVALFS